jgi:hypothetical protein
MCSIVNELYLPYRICVDDGGEVKMVVLFRLGRLILLCASSEGGFRVHHAGRVEARKYRNAGLLSAFECCVRFGAMRRNSLKCYVL